MEWYQKTRLINKVEATVKKDYKIISLEEFIFWLSRLRVVYFLDE